MTGDRARSQRHIAAGVAQLLLTGLAVGLSQVGLGLRAGIVAIMGVATLNAMMVAVLLLGVRREGRLIWIGAVSTVFLMIGLLVWPAWDVWVRARVF
jgi:hypothetical protein